MKATESRFIMYMMQVNVMQRMVAIPVIVEMIVAMMVLQIELVLLHVFGMLCLYVWQRLYYTVKSCRISGSGRSGWDVVNRIGWCEYICKGFCKLIVLDCIYLDLFVV